MAATTTTTTSNTTPYVWDPLTDALISDGTNEYVSGAGGGLLVQTPVGSSGSAALFGIPDNLGSTRVLQSSAGATQSTYAYDAFGVPKAGTGTTQTSLGYTGQLTDTETGFQDLRARMYDPSTGQFLSADTYGGSTQDALSLNGYSYADNAPTTLTDPTGHCGFPLGCLHQAGVSLTELAGTAYVAGSYGIGWATGAGASYLEQVQANFQHGQSPFAALTNVNTNALLQSGQKLAQAEGQSADSGAKWLVAHSDQVLIGAAVAIGVGVVGALLAPEIAAGLVGIGVSEGVAGVLASAGAGAIIGAGQQAGINIATGQPWNKNLGLAALTGAVVGGVAGVIFGPVADAVGSRWNNADEVATNELANEADSTLEGSVEGNNASPGCGGLSFAATTAVATPSGAVAISQLKVGDNVTAYDPSTGKTSTQTVQRTFINHDTDLVDVTLRPDQTKSAAATAASTAAAKRYHDALVAAHGAHASPAKQATAASMTAPLASSPADETVDTTLSHPWLTADRGWETWRTCTWANR